MASQELMSINTVAARLGLSVHQLRRWELMFGLDIKRGRGQQRQYRPEDLSVLERIRELVNQGWPTSQIRPQIEAEGLISPRLIGVPTSPGNPEVVLESIIGFRNFAERRFIEISKQIDELRQLVIAITLKQELAGETDSPWQPVPVTKEPEMVIEQSKPKALPTEIAIGPEVNLATPDPKPASKADLARDVEVEARDEEVLLPDVTDQNYLTVLGRALDLIGWSDEAADEYSETTFGVPHWDELGRSQAEKLIDHLSGLIRSGQSSSDEPKATTPSPEQEQKGTQAPPLITPPPPPPPPQPPTPPAPQPSMQPVAQFLKPETDPGEGAETSFEPPPFPETDISSEDTSSSNEADDGQNT